MLLLILLALVFPALGNASVPKLDGRIVGGEDANIADYPYQVSLLLLSTHICGGVIISNTWILTAAHCVDFIPIPSFIGIRAGSSIRNSGGDIYSVISSIVHPSYNGSTLDYDIALLRLSSPINTTNAQTIPLPSPGTGPIANSTVVITGWGTTSEGGSPSTILQVVRVPVVSQEDCRVTYGEFLTDRMFCAGLLGVGGKDACQGDSGGPVVIDGVVYGLVSWGYGCARPDAPGVKTNIPSLRAWITTNSAASSKDGVSLTDGRIIGGDQANIIGYPYQVSLEYLDSHRCGGTIISRIWIVTAAHCVYGIALPDTFRIRTGTSYMGVGGQLLNYNRLIIHPDYNDITFDFDIALFQLDEPITLGTSAQVVGLPHNDATIPDGTLANVTGWGRTTESGSPSTVLRVIEIPVFRQTVCRALYTDYRVSERMFCAGLFEGGKDACSGDGGGPLVINSVLSGIVSWGHGCARPQRPGVYASVGAFRDWITQQTGI